MDKYNPKNKKTIPSYYQKFVEPVYEENQKTVEKNWAMKEILYEITQDMKNLLKKHQVQMNPNDAEKVIDLWEKIAVND